MESLALADGIVVAGVFKQESIPEGERMHPEKVVADSRPRQAMTPLFIPPRTRSWRVSRLG